MSAACRRPWSRSFWVSSSGPRARSSRNWNAPASPCRSPRSATGPTGARSRTTGCISDGAGTTVTRVVLVTGGGTGVGAAITARFADEGALVAIGQRTQEEAEEAVRRLAAPGRELVGIGADLSTAAGCRDLATAAARQTGSLDVLVNNAALTGSAAMGSVLDYQDDMLDAVLEVNLKAPFRLARDAALCMPPGSVIVNITSVLADRAKPDTAAYQAAKA